MTGGSDSESSAATDDSDAVPADTDDPNGGETDGTASEASESDGSDPTDAPSAVTDSEMTEPEETDEQTETESEPEETDEQTETEPEETDEQTETETEPEETDEQAETDVDEEGEEAVCEFYDTVTLVEASEFPTGQMDGNSDADCAILDEQIEEARNRTQDLSVAPLAGTWRGGTGDDSVELIVDATGHGTLLYGIATAPEPIDDPSGSYLTNRDDPPLFIQNTPRLGFAYTIYPVNGLASEMVAQLRLGEPWQEWCGLQEPRRVRTCYACDAFSGSGANFMAPESACNDSESTLCYAVHSYESGETVATPMDCGRYNLCNPLGSVCACTSEECTEDPDYVTERTFSLDPVDTNVMRVGNRFGAETAYLTRVAE